MPETEAKEAKKVMRHWFQGKLAERMMQATSIAQGRAILRRGARKMQDGTLGSIAAGDAVEDDDMGVSVGNKITNYYGMAPPASEPEVARSNAAGSLVKTLLISAALVAGPGIGVAIPWALGAFDKPAAAAVSADTDTQYELRIGGGG